MKDHDRLTPTIEMNRMNVVFNHDPSTIDDNIAFSICRWYPNRY